MKSAFFTALALTAATVAIAPAAKAIELNPSLQEHRYEVLDRGGSKAIKDIQEVRLVHLDNQSKAIDDIQSTRLVHLDTRSKGNVHDLRLELLDNQSKAIEDIQTARLDALDARTKAAVR